MGKQEARLSVKFFITQSGREPVRDWLESLGLTGKKSIGHAIGLVQFRWPVGMPLVEKFGTDLWAVRARIEDGIARIFFTVAGERIILLHGFVKKSQKTPSKELALAKKRLNELEEGGE
ncbi:MAG: type II toxin-antitoxin system RelE/ParE family toxin [Actinomycetes bacterium]|jgi:phage-related protein|nr:type II toxin-antitoxin system RelE/ParE family toxin [Actinomycetes bacterium]